MQLLLRTHDSRGDTDLQHNVRSHIQTLILFFQKKRNLAADLYYKIFSIKV